MKNVYFSLDQEKSELTQPFLAASLFHLLLMAMLWGLGAPTAGASNGDPNHSGSEPAWSEVESTAPSGGGLDLASANGEGMPSLRTLGAGGTGCPPCTPATPCTGPYTGSITISTQTALNAFTGPGGCRYTTITGNLILDGNGNSATGTDMPGGDPITDLCNLQYLTSVGGSLTIRDFNVMGNPTNLDALCNLTTVGGNLNIGSNANDNNSSFTSINLSGLTSVGANFTVSHNPNVTSIAYPGVSVVGTLQILNNASANSISGFTGTVGNVSITLNGALNTINLGFSAVTGNLTVQNNGMSVSTINLSSLGSVGNNLSMNNAGANAIAATINLSSLTTVGNEMRLARAIGTLNATSLTGVGGNLIVTNNPAATFTSFDGSFSSLTNVGGALTIQNNTNLSTCCRVLCEITVGGAKTISGNASGCSSMADITATCTPPACPTGQTRNADPGVCTYTAHSNEFDVDCSAASISYTLTGATTGTHTDLDGVAFNLGTTTVTATVTSSGAPVTTATCTYTITVNDNQQPAIICPGMQSLSLDASCSATLPDYTGLATANDNCPVTISQSPAPGTTVSGAGPMTVTVTADDGNGNTATCSFTVNKQDNTPPSITCPSTQNLALDANCEAVLPDYTGMATTNDNCSTSITVDQAPTPGTTVSGVGTMTVTLTADDGNGNTATCSFSVNKQDNTPPSITCPSTQNLALDANCEASLPDYTSLATANDNCSVTIGQSPAPGTTVSGVGTVTVTLTADDGNGNTATCSFSVNKQDNTPPSITCPPTQTLTLSPTCSATLPNYTGLATTSDNCATTVTVTQAPPAGTTVSGVGPMTVTLTANDGNGNTATCTFIVNKVDNTPPVFTFVPANVTVQCNSIPAPGTPTATDACGPVTITYNGSTTTPGSCPDAQTIVHTWTAQDGSGNTATATRVVTVIDTQKPNFTSVPANVTVQCDNIPPVGTPTATDNCDNVVAITYIGQTTTNGSCPNQYTLTRRWVAADNCGNTRSTSQVITVIDTTKPVFTSVPANVTIQCSDPVPPVGAATATDNCGSVTVQYLGQTTISGSCPNKYQIKRTWKATDQCGNSTVATQTIQVDDTTPPVFTSVPANVTILCTEPLPPVGTPTATDACGGYVHITFLGNTPTGSGCETPYTVTRTWMADDLCGNTSTATQVITVVPPPIGPEEVEERDAAKPQAPQWDDDRILTLQPNPTTDRVLVGLGSFAGERVVVAIHNEMGQLIYERTIEAVPDLMVPVSLRESGATPGLFTVSVRSSGRVVAKRLVLIE